MTSSSAGRLRRITNRDGIGSPNRASRRRSSAGRLARLCCRARRSIDLPEGPEMERYQMLIGGEWVDAEGGATFESENPFRGRPWALVPRGTPADVERAVEAAL